MTLAPSLPLPGGKYCDPTFGTEVLRISDRANVVAAFGKLGFNKNSTRFAALTVEGQIEVFALDPHSLERRGPGTVLTVPLFPGCYFWNMSDDADAADTMFVGDGMIFYKVNVVTQARTPLADLSSLIDNAKPSNPKNIAAPSLTRCSASADTSILACAILIQNEATVHAWNDPQPSPLVS